MKILHISTYDCGGAGIAALRLHRSLLKLGVDSKMIVLEKSSDDSTIFDFHERTINCYKTPKCFILRKFYQFMRRRGRCLTKIEQLERQVRSLQDHYSAIYTFDITTLDLSVHPLVQAADVIHLHWIQDFVDYETFFTKVNKPILWTFHDLNPLFGGFHHYRVRDKYYEYYKDVEDELYSIKKHFLSDLQNLSIVALSEEMRLLISSHEIYSNKPIYQIANCIDDSHFQIKEKSVIRGLLGFDNSNVLFLFVNSSLNDLEKGLEELSVAMDKLSVDNALFVCVGEGKVPKLKNMKVVHYHSVKDSVWLSMLYSSADFLLFPSHQESFAQTPIEAMLCGTPVVMTPVGIASELINESNGVVCSGFSSDSLLDGIRLALERRYDCQKVRESVVEKYSPDAISRQYYSTYQKIMGSSPFN